MAARAVIHLAAGLSDERPQAVVEISGDETTLDSLRAAIEWADARAERVGVRYDGNGDYDQADPRVAELVRRWGLDQERHTAEYETPAAEPREWYLALEDPDVEGDPGGAARAVEEDPAVLRVITSETRDGRPLSFVDVVARTQNEALIRAHDAVSAVAWPAERIDRSFPDGGGWTVTVSRGNQTVGLVRYRYAHFFSPWPAA